MFSNTLLSLPPQSQAALLIGQHAMAEKVLQLCAHICLQGGLTLLDCGNRANIYAVARLIRPHTSDPVAALGRIRLSRAFTCYQVLALLRRTTADATADPVLILDFLATFLDEDVPLADVTRLFRHSLACIRQISLKSQLVLSVRPIPTIASSRAFLLEQLRQQMDSVWEESLPSDLNEQLKLFED